MDNGLPPGAIPSEQFEAAAPQQSAAPAAAQPPTPDSIPSDQFQSAEDVYGTTGQQIGSAIEGAAQGALGFIAPAFEKYIGIPEHDIRMRAETNPWGHGAAEAATFGVSSLFGVGEAAAAAHAAEAVAKSAEFSSKLATGATKAATELGLLSASDETSKAILHDPNQSVGSAVANIGMSALLGGASAPVFMGLGKAVDAAISNPMLNEFKDRLAARAAGLNPAELVEKEFNDTISAYNDMNDELSGPSGLKATTMGKLMPKEMSPEITNQISDVMSKAQNSLDEMISQKVPDRLSAKFQSQLDDLKQDIQSGSANPAQIFDSLNDFKQTLQKYSKGNYGPFAIPSHHEAYDFLNITKALGHDVRVALEDSKVWGKAADLQKNLNSSWTKVLPAMKDARRQFMKEIGGEYVPSTDKFKTYLNTSGKATSTTDRQKMMGNFIDGMTKHFDTVDKIYQDAGIVNPHPTPGMGALKESIEKQSMGAKLADMWHEKTAAGALGTAAGVAIGHSVLPGFGELGGAYVGKELLSPMFGAIAAPIMEKAINSNAVKQSMALAKSIVKGSKLSEDATKAIFAGSKNVITQLMPAKADIDKLDEQAKAMNGHPEKMTDIPGEVGHYLPNHGTAMAQKAGTAVAYINSQRPNTQKALPFDREPTVSKQAQSDFNRKLTVVQQPLSVLQRVKDGTLSPTDLQALNAVHPEMYQKMQQDVMAAMLDHTQNGGKVPYALRQSLSVFLAQPLDSTMTPSNIMAAQAVFAPQAPQQPPGSAKGGKKGATGKVGESNKNYMTPEQSAESHRSNRS